jgi:NitT/TauT family transport system permease protein
MGRSFGATGRQLFWQVRVPAASGLIGTGLRIGTIRGLKGLVNGEVLVAVVGLGRLVVRSGNAFTMDRLYAVVFFLVLLTFLATGAVRLLTRVVLKA